MTRVMQWRQWVKWELFIQCWGSCSCWGCWEVVSDGCREGWQGHYSGSVSRFRNELENGQKVCWRAAQAGPQCTVVAAGCVWRMDCRKQPGLCSPSGGSLVAALESRALGESDQPHPGHQFSQLMISKTGIILVLHGSVLASELLEFACTAWKRQWATRW